MQGPVAVVVACQVQGLLLVLVMAVNLVVAVGFTVLQHLKFTQVKGVLVGAVGVQRILETIPKAGMVDMAVEVAELTHKAAQAAQQLF
jgi:hypothetical protein